MEAIARLSEFKIPPNIADTLERIPPGVPDVFVRQAVVVASFIDLLDKGAISDNEANLFRSELESTSFIRAVYLNGQGLFKDEPSPQVALPKWLFKEGITIAAITKEDEEELANLKRVFNEWTEKKSFYFEDHPNGRYFVLDKTPPIKQWPRVFKCYIENNLLELITRDRLDPLFEDLKRLNLNPNTMKLFDDFRLVLYYEKDIDIAEGIRNTFKSHEIEFRGPAQDVFSVQPDEDGSLKVEVVISNDSALGMRGPIRYKVSKYDPAAFLDNYLQLCLWAGKNPQEPYKTSFVYLTDYEKRIRPEDIGGAVAEATKLAGYPIIYGNRLSMKKVT